MTWAQELHINPRAGPGLALRREGNATNSAVASNSDTFKASVWKLMHLVRGGDISDIKRHDARRVELPCHNGSEKM